MKHFIAPIAISLLIGISAFIAHITGYGAYWHYMGSFLAILILLVFSLSPIAALIKKELSLAAFIKGILIFILLPVLLIFAGEQIRDFNVRNICKASEPLFQALEQYKSKYNSYPKKLEDVQNIKDIQNNLGISIQQGDIFEGGIDVAKIANADVTIYLKPDYFYCVAPIQKGSMWSFSRFKVYARDSKSNNWYHDNISWYLGAIK